MNQQPDKLFREKLEGYNRPAPGSAWDKIDAGLQKKNNNGLGLMWKIAASLLLIAVVTYGVWPTGDKLPESLGTKQDGENKTVKPKEVQPNLTADDKSKVVTQSAVQPKETTRPVPKHKVDKPKEEVLQKNIPEEITIPTESNPVAIQTEEKSIEELPTIEIKREEAIAINTSTPEHTTIIVTAKEADEYLNKKELAQATSKEKRPSTLKKLLKKADDLTNDQDPFGGLRQKKNEILALNFKSDKQREQNK